MDNLTSDISSRTRRLLGDAATERLRRCRVIIFGVGGVGSWTAQALARSGVGHITLVDADRVAPSNINRQAQATVDTVGRVKVEALGEMLLAVNPELDLTMRREVYSAQTAPLFNLEDYDYVVDAIDSLADKALLILEATRARRPVLFSSMGAALKCDPSRIAVAEFWKVQGCPLAAALRRRFKRSGVFPRRKFRAVYSPELLPNLGNDTEETSSTLPMSYGKVAYNGSLCHITGIFGFTLAGLVIEHLRKGSAD